MKQIIRAFAFGFAVLVFAIQGSDLRAQGGGNIGGGNIGGGDNGGGQQIPNQQIPDAGGEETTSATGGDGLIGEPNNVEISVSDDIRNQGFVGPTSTSIVQGRDTEDPSAFRRNAGFIGAASDTSGPPIADGGSFGGEGINTGSGFAGGGGGRGAAGFGGAQNGFSVVRQSTRARLAPSFYAPRPQPQFVSSRFNNRLVRQPGSQNLGGNYQVRIENRTAYITGVADRYESQRIERQLRLEPGVYSIVNQLQVSGQ
jgi:hypothetical protein